MADPKSWFPDIQGIVALLPDTAAPNPLQRRGVLRVSGIPVFDNGTESVLGGIQTITGSGTWDGKSGIILVRGSGARSIAMPDPTALLQHAGLTVTVVDADGTAAAGVITIGSGAESVGGGGSTPLQTNNFRAKDLVWISAGVWALKE